jgi:CBS domain-containing protein
VADFVGAGRTLRHLDLLTAADAVLPIRTTGLPVSTTGEGPAVAPTATLSDAMAALLNSDASSVPVVDGDSVLGQVTLDSIRAALRRSRGDVAVDLDVEVET